MLMDVRVLAYDELPGSMAMTRDEDGTVIYISERARESRSVMDVAHDAAHLMMGVDICDDGCDYLAGKILRMMP